MQHILTLSRTAVIVRHWFEIDLDEAGMEHGVRIELRELAAHPRRGSESAAQLVAVDRPLWRADLFDRLADAPGTFGVAHYHPQFLGHEPCPRVWDARLTADPWGWLGDQFARPVASKRAGRRSPVVPGAWPVITSPAGGWMVLVADETGSHGVLAFAQAAGLGPVVHDNQPNRAAWRSGVPAFLPYPRPERAGQSDGGPSSPPSPLPCPGTPGPWRYPLIADCAVSVSTGHLRGASYSSRGARRNPSLKGRTDSDDSYRARTTSQRHRKSPRARLPGWPSPRAQMPGYPSGDHAGAGEQAPRTRAQASRILRPDPAG